MCTANAADSAFDMLKAPFSGNLQFEALDRAQKSKMQSSSHAWQQLCSCIWP